MNEQTAEWTNSWMNKQLNELTNEWTNSRMNKQPNEQTAEWTNSWMNQQPNERTAEWTNSRMNEQPNEQTPIPMNKLFEHCRILWTNCLNSPVWTNNPENTGLWTNIWLFVHRPEWTITCMHCLFIRRMNKQPNEHYVHEQCVHEHEHYEHQTLVVDRRVAERQARVVAALRL